MKYKKEHRCNYPITNDNINYCWGYAKFIDSQFYESVKNGLEQPRKISIEAFESNSCMGCEFYKPGIWDLWKHWKKKKEIDAQLKIFRDAVGMVALKNEKVKEPSHAGDLLDKLFENPKKPNIGQRYFYIGTMKDIPWVYYDTWKDTEQDHERLSASNVFMDSQEAADVASKKILKIDPHTVTEWKPMATVQFTKPTGRIIKHPAKS